MRIKLTKENVLNHFRYQAGLYVVVILLATLGWSLIFSVTKYVPPPEKTIDIYFFDDYFLFSDSSTVIEDAAADFPDMELIQMLNVQMSGVSRQKYFLTLAANLGDVYIIDRSYLSYFVNEGIAVPLEDYIESGVIDTDGMNLNLVTLKDPGNVSYLEGGEEHVYAIPASKLYGLMLDFFVDNRTKVILIPAYSKNPENAAKMIQWLYDRYYYEEIPEFSYNYDRVKQSIDNSGVLDTDFLFDGGF